MASTMKAILVLFIIINIGQGQRSFYASRYSKILPRFRTNEQESGVTTPGTVGTRQEDVEPTTSTTIFPFEVNGFPMAVDLELVRRISQWPEERKPFWFKNWRAISSMQNHQWDSGRISFGRERGNVDGTASRSPIPFPGFFGPSKRPNENKIKNPLHRNGNA